MALFARINGGCVHSKVKEVFHGMSYWQLFSNNR